MNVHDQKREQRETTIDDVERRQAGREKSIGRGMGEERESVESQDAEILEEETAEQIAAMKSSRDVFKIGDICKIKP